jgi:dihydropyrimidinase
MYDVLVRGGRVVLDGSGVVACDLGIKAGKVAGVLAPGTRVTARDTVDASHLVILPGVIDAHVHFGLGSPNDWETESRAAARGGITTVLNYIQGAESYHQLGPADRARAEASSVIDFGHHFILMNDLHLQEVPAYVNQLGTPSFKFFTNFKGTEGAYLGVEGADNGFFFDLCKTIARQRRAVLVVHTENIEIVWRLAPQLKAAGRDGLTAWADSRPDIVEAHDMFTAFMFAEELGTQIYIPHLSAARGLGIFREHRARGGRSIVETCPHFLTHTKESELGSLAKVNPPLRTVRDQDALWQGLMDGTISVVGSDHNSRPRARKEGSIWSATPGFPGVSTLLPVLLSEGYHRRKVPLERIAELISRNPARIFGLYPRKGAIAVGADADLTFVNLDHERVVDQAAFGSHAGYSIYDGWKLRGWPIMTMVRGRFVMRENEILVDGGYGVFLRRPVSAARAVSRRSTNGRLANKQIAHV